MEKVLITGGSGFIGKVLTDYLSNRHFQVYIFDRDCTQSVKGCWQGSLLNFEEVLAAVQGMDVVYHLAGLLGTTELLSRISEAIDVNIKGTTHLLEACRLANVKRVFVPTKPNNWLNAYSISKQAGESFAQMYRQMYGLDIRILRWLNVYGPRQKCFPVRKAVPLMILQALHGLPIEIFGEGQQPVDLIYVNDLVCITVKYMELVQCDALIRDTGYTIRLTINQLANLIKQMTASSSIIRHLPMRLGEDPNQPVELLDTQPAIDLLNMNEATTDLEIGMAKTIEYYQRLPEDRQMAALKFYYGDIPNKGDPHCQTSWYQTSLEAITSGSSS